MNDINVGVSMRAKVNFFWFRRDLRMEDNVGLYHALKEGIPTIGLFIFDRYILEKLSDPFDARVTFIHDTISKLADIFEQAGGKLVVRHGYPKEVWNDLLKEFDIQAVFMNRDYEPDAIERDSSIEEMLLNADKGFYAFKDHVIFEGQEVVKDDDKPYTVFTPYSKKWKIKLGEPSNSVFLQEAPSKDHIDSLKLPFTIEAHLPTLQDLGFKRSQLNIPGKSTTRGLIKSYDKNRDFPGIEGTSKLGIHFRFGTISIREKVRSAAGLNHTYLNELIWRDFYSMILQHFPHVAQNAFRAKYERIEWINNEEHFQAWCDGMTGYPLVDAGMRQLNQTGFMHNRVRMVAASFLTKHLLIDWRWGEAYFAEKLLDFDLASNNGGWQWAAGCGTDAAPYFRIFNPTSQQQKFDKDFEYISKYISEWNTDAYPNPIVDHREARERCLNAYKMALN